jgi:predicted hydrocarbon binding protein
MDNEILQGLEWDPDAGRLTFNQVRYLLIRPETLVDFQKAVEAEMGERAGEMIFAGGFTGGSLSSRRYKEVFGYSDEEIVRFMCRMGGQIGWGHFELVELDPGAGRLVVQVQDSPFAEAYGAAEHGVCHFIRGVMAGLGAGIFDAEVEAVETRCAAKGDAHCQFAIQVNLSHRKSP